MESLDWLPAGWKVEVKTRKSGVTAGTREKVYTDLESGRKFRSKSEVLRHLGIEKKPADHESHRIRDISICSRNYKKEAIMPMKHSPQWLPSGWITEIRTRKTGPKAGACYKCYISPSTGYKFYSKREVCNYLDTGKLSNEKPKRKKRSIDMLSLDNVVARIEKSPDWLPPGWTKEIKFRRRQTGDGFRCDPYYTDPLTGCIFRSKKNVFHYLETGEFGKHITRPKKRCIKTDACLMENKISLPDTGVSQKLARRCLLGDSSLNSDGITAETVSGSLLEQQCLEHARPNLRHGEEGAEASNVGHSRIMEGKNGKAKSRHGSLPSEGQSLYSEKRELLKKALPLESEDKITLESKLLLEPARKNQLEWSLLESEDKTPHLLEPKDKQQLDNGVPLQLVNATSLESEDKQPPNEMLSVESKELENKDRNFSDSGMLLGSQHKKQSENMDDGMSVQAEEKMSLQNGVLSWEDLDGVFVRPEEKIVLQNAAVSGLEVKRQRENGGKRTKTGISHPRTRKRQAKKSIVLPRRTSRRLAGIEAEVPSGFTNLKSPHQSTKKEQTHPKVDSPAEGDWKQLNHLAADLEAESTCHNSNSTSVQHENLEFESHHGCLAASETLPAEKLRGEKHHDCLAASEGPIEKIEGDKPREEKADSLLLPFGDSWPDPCLEFAFKTLTGAIPVVGDTLATQDYFEQLSMAHLSQSPGSSFCGSGSLIQGELTFQLESSEKQLSHKSKGLPCLLKNALKSEEESKDCQRTVNHQ